MIDSTIPERSTEWKCIQKEGYKICQSGSHHLGDFIRVFVPESPCRSKEGKIKVILYLHGFALCMPDFYEQHLKVLAQQQGYYVFFPDFQKSEYPNYLEASDIEIEKEKKAKREKKHLSVWLSRLSKLILKGDNFSVEDLFSEEQKLSKQGITDEEKLGKAERSSLFRVSLALVVLIVVINIYSWFNRTYGKNLIHLISTVALSLVQKPTFWIENANNLTEQAWQKLVKDNPELAQQEIDVYVFGHSLGGLLALSWPAYIKKEQKFFPKQIITADPAPSTEMGIPKIAILILKLFKSPFTAEPINIRESGKKLNLPVGIMHGIDDKIVKPESWVKQSWFQRKSNFDCIDSEHKQIYFSLSKSPDLIAFHNQAVTNTDYYDDELFKHFGGVKNGPNVYNDEYIWPGVNLVLREEARADELLDKFPLGTEYVVETLPDKPFDAKLLLAILFTVLALLGLGYWFLQFGTV